MNILVEDIEVKQRRRCRYYVDVIKAPRATLTDAIIHMKMKRYAMFYEQFGVYWFCNRLQIRRGQTATLYMRKAGMLNFTF